MNKAVIIGLSIAILFFIIGMVTLILVIAFRDANTESSSVTLDTDYENTPQNLGTLSRINWTEINRGFNSTLFPPCVEKASEIKKIFSILKSYNLEKKYMMLLDVYSMILCQDTQVRSRACMETFINDRLADLNTYGGDANSKRGIEIVKSVTDLQNNKMGKFLVMSTDLIEKEMRTIDKDNQISQSDKEQIRGFNSQFYRNYYDFMNKRCP